MTPSSPGRAATTTSAGSTATYAGGPGPARAGAKATTIGQDPQSVAATGSQIYVADTANHVVRRIDLSTGQEAVVAGNATAGYSGDGGAATAAQLRAPSAVAVDPGSAGAFFVADNVNHVIRRVDAAGNIQTVAGSGADVGPQEGPPGSVVFQNVGALVAVSSQILFVADNTRVHKVVLGGEGSVRTIAGGAIVPPATGVSTRAEDVRPATAAALGPVKGLAKGPAGELYLSDPTSQRVMRVTGVDSPDSRIVTVAGSRDLGVSSESESCNSVADGLPATTGGICGPRGLAVDGNDLLVAESYRHRVRRVALQSGPAGTPGTISTVAGTGTAGFSGDCDPSSAACPPAAAQLSSPAGLAMGPSGLFVADAGNRRVRRIDSSRITTVAGNGTVAFSGDCDAQSSSCPARDAQLGGPKGLAFDGAKNLYIADTANDRVRRVLPGGASITTVAGGAAATAVPCAATGDGGPAVQARLCGPSAVALNAQGELYVADTANNRIRKVDPTGTITTVAGDGTAGSVGDGAPATIAQISAPAGVAVDSAGNFYIADTGSNRIRKVDSASGMIATLAGTGTAGSTDGSGAVAQLNRPRGLSLDPAGNLYVADTGNHRIRKIDTSGTVSTVAGSTQGLADGAATTAAKLRGPSAVAVDGDDPSIVYVADTGNHRIRRVDLAAATVTTLAGTGTTGGFSGDGGPPADAAFNGPAGLASGASLMVADTANNRIRALVAGAAGSTLTDAVAPPPRCGRPPPPERRPAPTSGVASFAIAEPMAICRTRHTATALGDGSVLVAGGETGAGRTPSTATTSAEAYDPEKGSWRAAGPLGVARLDHTETLLDGPACRSAAPAAWCGKVLVTGGQGVSGVALSSAELYDPRARTFSPVAASMTVGRTRHTATLLDGAACHRPAPPTYCGSVLLVGSSGAGLVESAELFAFDPAGTTSSFTATKPMHYNRRASHTALALAGPGCPEAGTGSLAAYCGKVLVVGSGTGNDLASSLPAEIYDPQLGVWTLTAAPKFARGGASAVLLRDGRALVIGGSGEASAELYDPAAGTWAETGSMSTARTCRVCYEVDGRFTATLLADGTVLAAGGKSVDTNLSSADIFDPATGGWTPTRAMIGPHYNHTATLVAGPACAGPAPPAACGSVLIAGGETVGSSDGFNDDGFPHPLSQVESFVPGAASQIPSVLGVGPPGGPSGGGTRVVIRGFGLGAVDTVRFGSAPARFRVDSAFQVTAVAPSDAVGTVHVRMSAGDAVSPLTTEDLFTYGAWRPTADMAEARSAHTATLLADGSVLVAGGSTGNQTLTTTEVYDPPSASWQAGAILSRARVGHTATLLGDGRVLIAGGADHDTALATSELYDPTTVSNVSGRTVRGLFTATGTMGDARTGHTATVLADGRVLVVGGRGGTGNAALASAELFDPTSGKWLPTGAMAMARTGHTASRLPDGRVLIVGGAGRDGQVTGSAEMFDPSATTSAGGAQVRGAFAPGPALATARQGHTATVAPDGRVVVMGGRGPTRALLSSAEVYGGGAFAPAGALALARTNQGASWFGGSCGSGAGCGRVLVTGGVASVHGSEGPTATAEFYDPATGAASPAPSLLEPAWSQSQTVLADGLALAVGGVHGLRPLGTAALLEPTTGLVKPHIASLAPPAGPTGGATSVTVRGFGFWDQGATRVDFDGQAGAVTFLSDTEIVVETPPHRERVVDVIVSTTSGSSAPSEASRFSYSRGSWHAVGDLSGPRMMHQAVQLDGPACRAVSPPSWCGDVLVAGGVTDFSNGGPACRVSGPPPWCGDAFLPSRVTDFQTVPLHSAELYQPAVRSFVATGSMATPRSDFTATALDGPACHSSSAPNYCNKVLMAGGLVEPFVATGSTELYDPPADAFATCPAQQPVGPTDDRLTDTQAKPRAAAANSSCPGPLTVPRVSHTATMLDGLPCRRQAAPEWCGKVLVVGGARDERARNTPHSSVELYDPAKGTWSSCPSSSPSSACPGSMSTGRVNHTASLLADGKVLVVGGIGPGEDGPSSEALTTTEIYDPDSGTWATCTADDARPGCPAPMDVRRFGHTATLLGDGRVLVAGGSPATDYEQSSFAGVVLFSSSEIYDPSTGGWSPAGSMKAARIGHAATLLADGRVLVVGVGLPFYQDEATLPPPLATSELFDPRSGRWVYTGSLATARGLSTATVLGGAGCRSAVPADWCGGVLVTGGTAHLARPGRFPTATGAAEVYLVTPGPLPPVDTGPVDDPVDDLVDNPPCPSVSTPGAGQISLPSGYSLLGLPAGTATQSRSPLYGWFDAGAGGSYSVAAANAPVEAGRGYWSWSPCPRLLDVPPVDGTASFGLGGYHASMVGNPSGTGTKTVSGHDFVALWDPLVNGGAGGYRLSDYQQPQSLGVGEGSWVFSYRPTTISVG